MIDISQITNKDGNSVILEVEWLNYIAHVQVCTYCDNNIVIALNAH